MARCRAATVLALAATPFITAATEDAQHKKPATCNMQAASQYPPPADTIATGEDRHVKRYTVSLDDAPEDRWSHIVAPRKAEIAKLADVILDAFAAIIGQSKLDLVLAAVKAGLPGYYAHLPDPLYGQEIKGIARATGIDESTLFIFNIFYSIFGACTSIVAQTDTGDMYHARNLDFGLWPALNVSFQGLKPINVWELTSRLRPLVVNVDMVRGNATVFRQTTFAGFIGAHSAVRPHGWSLSIDSRFDDHLDSGVVRWLLGDFFKGGAISAREVTMVARHALEHTPDYATALAAINKTQVLGPAYIILGGIQPGEGRVLTKGAKRDGHPFKDEGVTIDDWSLHHELRRTPPRSFLVQTNYDRTGPPPTFDDRRNPAVDCLEHHVGGPKGYGFEGLYNVLSATPNLNLLTTYTTLMHARTGELEAYRQACVGWQCPLF